MSDWAVRTAFTASDKVSPAFKQMSASASSFGKVASSIGSAAKMLLPAFGGFALVSMFQSAMDKAKSYEASLANVRAGLKSTKNAAGLTEEQLVAMSKRLSSESMFGGGAILQNATAQLLTFTGITSANFERVQKLAGDITAKLKGINATGEDLHGVSIMIGKAMENPIRGLTAMRRIGISFSDSEEAMVKRMMASNNVIGAQNYMLKVIEKQYGGTAAALMQTAQGQEMLIQKRIDGALVGIGRALLPIKRDFLELGAQILPLVADAFGKIASFITEHKDLIIKLVGVYAAYRGILLLAKAAQIGWAAVMGIGQIIGWVQYLWMMRDAIGAAVVRTNAWAVAQRVINFLLSMNPIGLVIIAVGTLVYAIHDLYTNWEVYALRFNIWIQDFITGFRYMKMEVYELLNLLGLITDKELTGAKLGYLQSFSEGNKMKLDLIQKQKQAPNAAEAEGKYMNNIGITVNNNGTQSSVETTPRGVAKADLVNAGVNI